MATLYVTSPEAYSGKSALCVGLGRYFRREGYSVGYMKPVSCTANRVAGELVDEDAKFIKEAFGLREPLTTLTPACLDTLAIEATLVGEGEDYVQRLKTAFETVSRNKDIVLLEGGNSLWDGFAIELPAYKVSNLLKAKELVVVRYSEQPMVDQLLASKELLGESMLGAVINIVPRQRCLFVEEVVKPFLEHRGVKVYGMLPQERILRSISVSELAEVLGGEILCCSEALDELVEHLMVGAMSVDSALSYFRRKPNKAVITGGDRPDIQLAALETSTKCLILTGNLHPSPIILGRAEEVGVPMILVKKDTLSTVEIIEQFFGKTRFHQEKKIHRFERILTENFDFAALNRDLGIGGQ